ncbi:hypothetical protein [uncultured Xylophilus sp.]|uniref:hypothetical protein n=1 Tax=uncultured Xylophilus sp. TaxID=296832 RepID=UPI0025E951DE|nr:hypothetical protein [uncultured Xylophilus sp.]
MSESAHFTIIPATPGYRIVYDGSDGLFVSEHVIAWRIETFEEEPGLHSTTTPITVEGEPGLNWAGLLSPDGSVSWAEAEFSSLEEANKAWADRRR